MVSIITTSYNSEKTIKRTIESILNQTESDIEHVFIDGLSKDNTVQIIKSYENRYKDREIRLKIVSEKDDGLYDAMNKGIKIATGSIIGILNSDDWYETDAIETVKKVFEANKDIDILMGNIRIQNKDKSFEKKAKISSFMTTRYFNHPAMFATKDCYDRLGVYDNFNFYGDFDWYLKANKKGAKILTVDRILTNFMTGGVSSQKSFQKMFQKINCRFRNYRRNGYSRFYLFESVFQEIVKYVLVKN